MSYSTLRAFVKTTLEGINTIEKVQDYRRHHVEWDKIASSFKDSNNRIHAWIIEWDNSEPELEAVGSRVFSYIHTVRLIGLYSLNDTNATGKTFEDECDSVLDEFNAVEWITNNGSNFARLHEPAKLDSIDEAEFSGVLCHRAFISMQFNETRSYT